MTFFEDGLLESARCGPFLGIFWYLATPSFPEALQSAVLFVEVLAAQPGP